MKRKSMKKWRNRVYELIALVFIGSFVFLLGWYYGYNQGFLGAQELSQKGEVVQQTSPATAPPQVVKKREDFTGPELWEAVNNKRMEYGVGRLGQNDLLCSIASYRLNQLLGRGSLDNHAGFNEIWQNEDHSLRWIGERFSNITEFIVYIPSGTAQDAVSAWDDTLGHRILLSGGQFTVGCTYAQAGFGVAIVGF